MKSVFTVAAILLAANVATAADNADISEFHQHAMAGQKQLTPSIMYNTSNQDATGGSIKTSGFDFGVEGEWGVGERLSAGAEIGYLMGEAEQGSTKIDVAGLQDMTLFVRGSNEMGAAHGHLAYGLNLGFSLGDAEQKANGDLNAQTGGMSLSPYVGYEMPVGPGVLGGQVNYTWRGERTTKDNTSTPATTSKTEDGHSTGLAAFYEYDWSAENSVGVALTYGMTGNTKSGTTTNTDEETAMGVNVYAPMMVGDGMTAIPMLQWISHDPDATGANDTTELNLGVALRMNM